MASSELAATAPTVAAIVLTGGTSSRMGTDKASLVVDGLTMVDRVMAVLQLANITNIVVAGSAELPDPAFGDRSETQGPLAGLTSGWTELRRRESRFDPVVVLSCDLPSISDQVINALVTAATEHRHGALAHDGERPQPLIAAYRPHALDELVSAYERGERSVRRCFDDWDLGHLQFDQQLLTDADTPADLDGFEVEWPTSS